jgi:hypothetical protein
MVLIEILLPLYDNNREPFGQAMFNQVRDELAEKFGGVTAFRRSPAEGIWQVGDQKDSDEIIIYEVMVETLDRDWWSNYRKTLEAQFRQEEMVIRASPFERL